MANERVVVGLSGGVDSSVAAYLLQEQGYEVIGLFMKNWHDESVTISDECPWVEDSNDALLVAQKLGIPFQTIDLSEEYKKQVVDYMFAEYENGRTPNPDVLCNREIKFDVFLKAAMSLGADYVATGHYCRKSEIEVNGEKKYQLKAGVDSNKDQSYFLCQLTQEQLAKSLFPVGHLEKPEVRKIAAELDLVTADKKDSQGICFVGKVKLPDFLQQQLKPKAGEVYEIPVDAPSIVERKNALANAKSEEEWLKLVCSPYQFDKNEGRKAGDHRGAHFFTIGQRKGLNIGGTPKPLFIIGTDVKENLVFAGQGGDHPGLIRSGLFIDKSEEHWVRPDLALKIGESKKMMGRIRYREDLSPITLFKKEEGLYIVFDQPRKGIAAGQFAAWYDEDELVGSGVING
ncbi:tRNA 2-thiouridine(34) synthase MnmA [Aureibacter tunicatorum]|uniref:tRNA-specific 2-thiouridylase MnmA n=1 Tax=Aureibacter tunicatorum TaxID=866807 RepID=A0AAE3XL53_9BACT|nr:tRNA-specific 2-thiouridylase [Aureibacter tunicatorum]BDD04361.1 tRNA-specific 2-thiouridylase MnmA [Aureibacter tunicatorum]